MGRRIPTANDQQQNLHNYNYYHHQQNQTTTISLSLVLIAMAATISFATLLCGVRFGRKPKPESNENSLKNSEETTSSHPQRTEKDKDGDEEYATKELPLPPAKQAISPDPFPGNVNLSSLSNANAGSSLDQYITKSASSRNFKSAISLKVPRSMSVARTITSFRETYKAVEKKGGGGGKEESVWTKTIILGEKCKVPDAEEEEVVVRDGKGKRVPTFHPRSSSLLPSNMKDEQPVTDQGSDSNNVNSPEVS